jgi:hypothetical protein
LLSVIIFSAFILSLGLIVTLSTIFSRVLLVLSVIILSTVMLSVIILSVFMLSLGLIVTLSTILSRVLSVIILNAVMLSHG